jgi:hypothetical protein
MPRWSASASASAPRRCITSPTAGQTDRLSCALFGSPAVAHTRPSMPGPAWRHGPKSSPGMPAICEIFEVAQSTVSKYMVQGGPRSQGWKTFLRNHARRRSPRPLMRSAGRGSSCSFRPSRRWKMGRHRSFKRARAFVLGLNLKSGTEWRDYCMSGKKPADIPNVPHKVYANDGWAGFGDWLGTGRVAAPRRRESEARTVVPQFV